MENPRLYQINNSLVRRGVKWTFDNYFHLLKWKNDGSETVLDVGCGPGDVTVDLLLPKLPENILEVVCCDISSKMIDYAKLHYPATRVSYNVLDIGAANFPDNYKVKFSHVFSFYCLNWVENQRQAYENIYNALRPGGEMLIIYLDDAQCFGIFKTMSLNPRWSKYMQKFKKYTPPFIGCNNTEEILASMLEKVGFEVSLCKKVEHDYVYDDAIKFRGFLTSINPYLKEMEVKYHEDFLNELSKGFKITRNGDKDNVHFPTRVIVMHATKPCDFSSLG